MAKQKDRIKRAVERLILRLSRYELNSLGRIVKKIRRNHEKGN